MSEPTITELHVHYPQVRPFVARMLRELWANRGKGDQAGWRRMDLRQAWSEISWHNAKLAAAIRAEDIEQMRELAADIANGAMMLTDILDQYERGFAAIAASFPETHVPVPETDDSSISEE